MRNSKAQVAKFERVEGAKRMVEKARTEADINADIEALYRELEALRMAGHAEVQANREARLRGAEDVLRENQAVAAGMSPQEFDQRVPRQPGR
jgi:hypothetical protein